MAKTNTNLTFPGVYTQVVDQSFVQPATNAFLPGFIGAATKGSFDTPTVVTSLKDFTQKFGKPLTTGYDSDGNPIGKGLFLADAVAMVANFADTATVVRVGNQYIDLAIANGSGSIGSYTLKTSANQSLQLNPNANAEVYVRVVEAGFPSTVNAKVISAGNGTVSLDPTGVTLAASYDGAAAISYSNYANAANAAEGLLYAYTYGTSSNSPFDAALTQFGSITGTKNNFQFTVQSAGSNIGVGSVYKIRETSHSTTSEVRIKQVIGNTVYLETSDLTRVGYQALPLQDNYDNGVIYEATGSTAFLYLQATESGEWANGNNSAQGLYVRVRPGSAGGTKKIEVFWDSALVETFDNLSDNPASADYYTTRINTVSQFIMIMEVNSVGGGQLFHAANTVAPWDSSYYTENMSATPVSMPSGALNAGIVSLPYSSTVINTGGQFDNGFNGENPQDNDFIGTVDPNTDTNSGLKAFTDDNVTVNVIAAPMNNITMAIQQELAAIARQVNAVSLVDVPAGITARQAIDWQNGKGAYMLDAEGQRRGRVDSYSQALFWNWITVTDPFTGLDKMVPPSIGALRAMAYTYQVDFPWYAAAGLNRGQVPEASACQFPRVSPDVKQAMYGNGQSVNPILQIDNVRYVFGERTLQVAESKLVQIHAVNLVNYIVDGLDARGKRFVFEPNDQDLLVKINLNFTEFLDGIKNQRGLEQYVLICDSSNNTPDTRNAHEVIVDLAIIPTDVAERIFINITVNASGAQLNNVTAG